MEVSIEDRVKNLVMMGIIKEKDKLAVVAMVKNAIEAARSDDYDEAVQRLAQPPACLAEIE